MIIQINLAPGSRKGARSSGALALTGKIRSLAVNVRDPWLIGAASTVVVSVAAVGLLFTTQSARASELNQRLEVAVRDSTGQARFLDALHKLKAERDSVHRQVQIIRTIDDNRYNWAHILDEISRALPAYTWLTSIEQTSRPPLPPGAISTATPAAAPGKAAKDSNQTAVDSVPVHPPLTFRVVGQTVDIQALTMFMRQLENSPFVEQVALTKSEIVIVDGKDVTQFELSAAYVVPTADVVETSPLVVPLR